MKKVLILIIFFVSCESSIFTSGIYYTPSIGGSEDTYDTFEFDKDGSVIVTLGSRKIPQAGTYKILSSRQLVIYDAFGQEVFFRIGDNGTLVGETVPYIGIVLSKKVPEQESGAGETAWPFQVVNGMIRLPGGTFIMGSPLTEHDRRDDEIQHEVMVSAFWIGQYEVTQEEYQELMGTNPSHFKGDNLPVEQVSWFDAVRYCNARSQREGLIPAYTIHGDEVTWNQEVAEPGAAGYRLPTEAEWEYACRAGTTTAYCFGDRITPDDANYNSSGTKPVGSFAPNSWGIYDMHGNVWEWCWDWYGSYPKEAQTDPTGPLSKMHHGDRGGGWSDGGRSLRSSNRGFYYPSGRLKRIGFRLARGAE